jgi:hypothetical protein
MYYDWKKSGAHTTEWMNKTQKFIDYAFSGPPDEGVKCPCSRYRNTLREDKRTSIRKRTRRRRGRRGTTTVQDCMTRGWE